eukprot:811745-Prymnesium_polylepis.1
MPRVAPARLFEQVRHVERVRAQLDLAAAHAHLAPVHRVLAGRRGRDKHHPVARRHRVGVHVAVQRQRDVPIV